MKEEDKQLLLTDLSARLPYGIVAQVSYKDREGWKTEDRKILGIYTDRQVYVDYVYTNIENTKPYLRSMFSMTEEELKEWIKYSKADYDCEFTPELTFSFEGCHLSIDWLNAHHFDYRNLIEKGLALEAPKDMYKL